MLLNLFPLLLLIFSLFGAFVVSVIVWWEEFLFRSNQFGVLKASCMFMSIIFYGLGKFSSIILLKIFTGPLSWKSLLSSIPIILRFGLLLVSYISWMFWVRSFLLFAFSLTVVSMFFMVSSTPEILLSISCILLWCLHLWFLISFLSFLTPGLSPFVIYYFHFHF